MTSATRLSRAERSAVTRSELLAAAERRFFEDGYHATTLEDIADEAGYTKGAVYSAFKSKAGLFLALFDTVIERRLEGLRELVESNPEGRDRLAALSARRVEPDSSRFLLLSIEFLIHAAREPALLEGFNERYRQLRDGIAALAPKATPLGAERWARATLALSNGLALERLIDPDGVPDDLMAAVQRRIAPPDVK